MVLVVPVRARAEHGREPLAGGMQHALAQSPRHGAVGQRDQAAVGELEGANVERVGAAVLGELGADDAVAAAALERVEIVEIGDGGAEALRQRRDIAADPLGQRGRHGTAQDRRRLHRNPPLVRQHDRLQPHQILAPAAAGALDVGDAGRNRDFVGQRQPAGRWLWRGLRCGRGLLVGLAVRGRGLLLLVRLVALGRRRLGRARLRQRHRRAARRCPRVVTGEHP